MAETKAEDGQWFRWPAGGAARWFADDELTADSQEGSSALSGNGRRTEAPSHDRIRCPPEPASPHDLRSSVHDLHVRQAKRRYGVLEEGAPLLHRIDEHEGEVGTGAGQYQPWDAAAAPEIDDRPCHGRQGLQESRGVIDVLLDRSRTKEPQASRPLQLPHQRVVHGCTLVLCHRTVVVHGEAGPRGCEDLWCV